MDAVKPVGWTAQLLGRESNNVTNARRIVYFAGCDVPIVDTFIHRLHGQCIALFAVAKRLFRLPTTADVADCADEADHPTRLIADRQAVILDPAVVSVCG